MLLEHVYSPRTRTEMAQVQAVVIFEFENQEEPRDEGSSVRGEGDCETEELH